jgi:hypothetical protein
MSITINGATNTITGAAGLAIAANTAVTGTLSATSTLSTSTKLDIRADATSYVDAKGIYLANAGNTRAHALYVNNSNGSLELDVYNGSAWTENVLSVSSTGLAVTGTLSATGITSVTDTTDATSTTAASLKTAGGLAVAKSLWVGGNGSFGNAAFATIGPTTVASGCSYLQLGVQTSTGGASSIQSVKEGTGANTLALNPTGGLVTVGSTGLSVTSTTDSSSTTTGALVVSGGVGIAKKTYCGDNIVMASGKGIDFSAATPDGSGTTGIEVLSDYEEGTFTPTVSGTSTAGAGTYTNQAGWYVKVGNLVHYNAFIAITAHTGTGNTVLGGLPFTSLNSALNISPCAIAYTDNLTLTAGNIVQASVNANATTIAVYQTQTGGGAIALVPLDTAFTITLSGTYRV